jgi:histidinol phosphatase-like enzyme
MKLCAEVNANKYLMGMSNVQPTNQAGAKRSHADRTNLNQSQLACVGDTLTDLSGEYALQVKLSKPVPSARAETISVPFRKKTTF